MTSTANTRKLTILAQDPSVKLGGRIAFAQVDVPAEVLSSGPVGHRVKVIDFDASANVLYAPGVRSLGDLRRITAELKAPFNILAPFIPGATVAQFAEAGAKRISIGGALNWAAVYPVLRAGKEMIEQGSFGWMASMASSKEVNQLLAGN